MNEMSKNEHEICFIFDLDGTLLDSITALNVLFTKTIPAKFGKTMSKEKEKVMTGQALSMISGKASKWLLLKVMWWFGGEIGIKRRHRFKMIEAIQEEYEKTIPKVPFFPGTLEGLEKLKKYTIALNTSSSREEFDGKFSERKDLLEIFGSRIVTRSDVENLKPSPESIFKISQMTNIPPNRCVMVGDMPVDIECGKSAGCCTIAVLCGYFNKELLTDLPDQPDFVFNDVLDLADHLCEIEDFVLKR
jgi:pyrophosphatase PpaX